MACIHQNSIFLKIHIPRSGKFEGWIGKSLNARDKSILQSNAPSPIWWRYGGRSWSCSLLIGCGIFDYQRILFILRLARLLTAPLPAWACLRLIGFGRALFPGFRALRAWCAFGLHGEVTCSFSYYTQHALESCQN